MEMVTFDLFLEEGPVGERGGISDRSGNLPEYVIPANPPSIS